MPHQQHSLSVMLPSFIDASSCDFLLELTDLECFVAKMGP